MHIRSCQGYQQVLDQSGKSGGIHPYAELLWIWEGEAVLEWMGLSFQVTSPGLFVLLPDTPHLLRFHSPLSFWYVELELGDEPFLTEEEAVAWNRLQRTADYTGEPFRRLGRVIQELTDSLPGGQKPAEPDEELMLLDIRKTLLLLRRHFHEQSASADKSKDVSTRESIRWLIRQMETHYYEPLDLTALAAQVYLHPSYLVRAFKSEAGVTPIHYLNKLRLNAAVSYLANTEMGIQEIAESTGFSTLHYFSRLFKQKFGVSPREWRGRHKRDRAGAT